MAALSEVSQMADASDIIESGVLILDNLLNSGPSTLHDICCVRHKSNRPGEIETVACQ